VTISEFHRYLQVSTIPSVRLCISHVTKFMTKFLPSPFPPSHPLGSAIHHQPIWVSCGPLAPACHITMKVSPVFQPINRRLTVTHFSFCPVFLFQPMTQTNKKRARESSPATDVPRQVRTKLAAFDERYDTSTKSNEDVLSTSSLS
jgi:hypothetical protein